jgi:peptide-methionine (R)-S-oxide reductase
MPYVLKTNKMKMKFLILPIACMLSFIACNGQQPEATTVKTTIMTPGKTEQNQYNTLTPQEENVLLHKATDRPFTGEYYQKKDKGIYICRQCNNPLYHSEDKFESHCGWPSFDDEIKGSVVRVRDADGYRVEIICNNCKGHLGHVFEGEGFTDKDTRHCVNTSSIKFIPASEANKLPPVIVLKK